MSAVDEKTSVYEKPSMKFTAIFVGDRKEADKHFQKLSKQYNAIIEDSHLGTLYYPDGRKEVPLYPHE